MKDKLGREIKAGDTVAAIATDYSLTNGTPRGRSYLSTHVVTGSADFAVQLEGGKVLTNTEEVVIVEMTCNVWGLDESGKTGA
jgi:hypothetical protein